MKVRILLVCTLLLLAAVPTFARPLCAECNYEYNVCESLPGSIERCRYNAAGQCYTDFGLCTVPRETPVLADWNVASIEISRPSLDSVAITAPAVATEAPAPAPQAAELK